MNKRKWIITVLSIIGVLFFIGLLNAVFGNRSSKLGSEASSPKLVTTVEQSTTEAITTTKEQNVFQIGDTVENGEFAIRVDAVEQQKSVSFSRGFISYTADGIYYIVNITYKNIGKKSTTLHNGSFKLILDGSEYMPVTLLGIKQNLFIDTINPGIEKQGVLYFDVPEDVVNASGLQLKMESEFFNSKKNFSIQLNL